MAGRLPAVARPPGDAPAALVDEPGAEDRPVVEDAVADGADDPRPVDDPAAADGHPRRRQRRDLGPARPAVPGARRSRAAARAPRDARRGGGRGGPGRRGRRRRLHRHAEPAPRRRATSRRSPSPRTWPRSPWRSAGGAPLRLGDVAGVVEGLPRRSATRSSTTARACCSSSRSSRGATRSTSRATSRRRWRRCGRACRDVEIDSTIFRPATFIERSLDNLQRAMLLGCVLVSSILVAFLFDWRTALISLVAIPLSLLAAVLVLTAAAATINTMVLAGLVIALGEVVDDAIIDVENILRRLRQNRAAGSPGRPSRSCSTPRSRCAAPSSSRTPDRGARVPAGLLPGGPGRGRSSGRWRSRTCWRSWPRCSWRSRSRRRCACCCCPRSDRSSASRRCRGASRSATAAAAARPGPAAAGGRGRAGRLPRDRARPSRSWARSSCRTSRSTTS